MVTFELMYSAACLSDKATASEECFGVSITYEGIPLSFPGECTGDLFTLNGCSFPEFLKLIEARWYSGPNADDLDQACATPYSPSQI